MITPALRYLSNHTWAMVPETFEQLVGLVERHAAGVRLDADALREIRAGQRAGILDATAPDDQPGEATFELRGSVAVVSVRGVLARYADQVNGACQPQGRSAESMQADLQAAFDNPRVKTVLLRLDSPGGTVAGTAETAQMIRELSSAGKPVIAFVDGLAASAAYWLASQADEIVASSPTTSVGSIGVITAMVDASGARDKQGVKVHVVRSVPLKAPGTANESINPDQLASVQRLIADLHDAFAQAVAAGRGLNAAQLAQVSTGEVFTAQRGLTNGLVDRIASFTDLLASLDPSTVARPMSRTTTQAPESPMKITTATILAIVAACPEHAALATSFAEKPEATDSDLFKAVLAAERERSTKAVAQAAADLAGERTARAGDVAKITALESKVAELTKLGKAGPDAGSLAINPATAGLTGPALWKAEFEASSDLQAKFALGGIEGYLAYRRNAKPAAKA